jgi:hypothetical protein
MPKGQYERKPKQDFSEGTTTTATEIASVPSVQEIVEARLKIVKGPRDRRAMLEKMVGMIFRPHTTPSANCEYIWERDGQLYSITVKAETMHPRELVSNEYYGGNQTFITSMRGNTVIATNDPRRKHEIEPDPGPQVFCKSADGECFTLTCKEFLDMVNENHARVVSVVVRNNR